MSAKARSVFITGASSGIGLATAQIFAEKKWSLVLNARDESRLRDAAKDLHRRFHVDPTLVPFDVSDRKAIERAERGHPEAFHNVDVLVNNAGLARGTDPIPEAKPEDWDEMIDVNVKGLLYVTRVILPSMLKRGSGHIVNLGSTAGHWTYRGGAVYSATKHAERAISEALRLDVHGSGLRVTSIDPGLVETNFSVVRFRGDKERAKKVYEGMTPLTPRDIAECIWWAVERPAHVNIHEIILMPTDQSGIRDVHRRVA